MNTFHLTNVIRMLRVVAVCAAVIVTNAGLAESQSQPAAQSAGQSAPQISITSANGAPSLSVSKTDPFSIHLTLPPGSEAPETITIAVTSPSAWINDKTQVTLTQQSTGAGGTVYSSEPIRIDTGSTFNWIRVDNGGDLTATFDNGGQAVTTTFKAYDNAGQQAAGDVDTFFTAMQQQMTSVLALSTSVIDGATTALANTSDPAARKNLQDTIDKATQAKAIATAKLDVISTYFRVVNYYGRQAPPYRLELGYRLAPYLTSSDPNVVNQIRFNLDRDVSNGISSAKQDIIDNIVLPYLKLTATTLYQAYTDASLGGPLFTIFTQTTIWGNDATLRDNLGALGSLALAGALAKGLPALAEAVADQIAPGMFPGNKVHTFEVTLSSGGTAQTSSGYVPPAGSTRAAAESRPASTPSSGAAAQTPNAPTLVGGQPSKGQIPRVNTGPYTQTPQPDGSVRTVVGPDASARPLSEVPNGPPPPHVSTDSTTLRADDATNLFGPGDQPTERIPRTGPGDTQILKPGENPYPNGTQVGDKGIPPRLNTPAQQAAAEPGSATFRGSSDTQTMHSGDATQTYGPGDMPTGQGPRTGPGDTQVLKPGENPYTMPGPRTGPGDTQILGPGENPYAIGTRKDPVTGAATGQQGVTPVAPVADPLRMQMTPSFIAIDGGTPTPPPPGPGAAVRASTGAESTPALDFLGKQLADQIADGPGESRSAGSGPNSSPSDGGPGANAPSYEPAGGRTGGGAGVGTGKPTNSGNDAGTRRTSTAKAGGSADDTHSVFGAPGSNPLPASDGMAWGEDEKFVPNAGIVQVLLSTLAVNAGPVLLKVQNETMKGGDIAVEGTPSGIPDEIILRENATISWGSLGRFVLGWLAPQSTSASAARVDLVDLLGGSRPRAHSDAEAVGQNHAAEPRVEIVATGRSSGPAFQLRLLNAPGRKMVVHVAEGLVLQPLKEAPAAKPVMQGMSGAQLAVSYCLNFAKLPPPAGTLYRIADQALQQQYGAIARVMRASDAVAKAGRFHSDTEPKAYGESITQLAIWSTVEKWSPDQLASHIVEVTRKNIEARGQKWTPALERQAHEQLVPRRLQDVAAVQAEAQAAASSN